ncbi:carbohydrate-binding protein [Streptomyces sp. Da 82-17]|uniref:carbohydrate-binding protein n=1 Tax=Streptomyces sp. Da 82-17 TaxID=3377116 RepID=UPI0038D3D45A
MTAGNNGASQPQDDDPFGYLYADGQAAGATPPGGGGGGYGYPGRSSSFQQVRTVGERQYGQQGAAAGPGAAPGQVPQQNAHYAAPETLPGGQHTRRAAPPADQRGGRGPNTKGLLIGAIAVVAAVVVGIGAAMLSNSGDDPDSGSNQAGSADTAGGDGGGDEPNTEPSKEPEKVELPKEDAKALTLAGGTTTASDVQGAKSGTYVQGLNTPGASATWTFNGIPKDGKYTLHVQYGVPGKDQKTTLTVNGKQQDRKLNMSNFAGAEEGDWAKGWTNTWANIQLTKGTNTIKISCESGDQCDAYLDQLSLSAGWR